MAETIIAFIIWCIVGIFIVGLGISCFFSKKAVGFWANAKMFEVTDIKKYNASVGKLFCAYGIVFIISGFPLVEGQNSPWIILSVIAVMLESIAMMGIYTIVIEKKYKKVGK